MIGGATLLIIGNQDNMALFFDNQWFDTELGAMGLDRDAAADRLALTRADVDQMFKDQRELSAEDVLALADLLGHSVDEIADRAGVSTPVPQMQKEMHKELHQKAHRSTNDRVAALEATVGALQAELMRLREKLQDLEFAARSSSSQGQSDKDQD